MKKAFLLPFLCAVAGCSGSTEVLVPRGGQIVLQQPVTREIFVCADEAWRTADDCAYYMEQQEGYVRLTDKAVFTGKDDIPQDGAYPTRRYRDNQNLPRW